MRYQQVIKNGKSTFTIDQNLDVTGSITQAGDSVCVVKVGTYTGDGTTSQGITGVGFQPKIVIIIYDLGAQGGAEAWMAVEGLTAGFMGHLISSGSNYDDRILSLDADGFTVDDEGIDAHPNKDTITYVYLCLG